MHPEAEAVLLGAGASCALEDPWRPCWGAGRLHVLSDCIYALLIAKILRLGEEVSLLGASTERRLAAARLEAVRLEDALEGLGGRALAGAAATTGHASTNGGRGHGGRHFVLRVRQTFRMNARSKKNGACVYWTSCWVFPCRRLWGLWVSREKAGGDGEVAVL